MQQVTHIPWNINQVEVVVIRGRTPERSCNGKKQYRTFDYARMIAGKIFIHDQRPERRPMDVYLCPFCKFYHLGHPPGSNRTK